MKNLTELHTVDDLEHALKESDHRTVLIFKHSLTCPISSRAFDEFESYLEHADPRVSYNLITIQNSRSVSSEATAKLEIEHESPQAILVKNGRSVWSASHFGITESSLDEAIHDSLG
jgi:bacillithiol system protein YtxJ